MVNGKMSQEKKSGYTYQDKYNQTKPVETMKNM
jgi:hypothetical protein